MSNTSRTRLRLKFNFRTKGVETKQVRSFAAAVVEDVAVDASDQMWKTVQSKIANQLGKDVFSEIVKMAQLYKQYVIGISGQMVGAQGKLTPASKFADGSDYGQLNYNLGSGPAGRWPRRSQPGVGVFKPNGDYYLPWKRARVGHTRWFEHTGMLGSVMGRGSFWTDAFGPVRVTVTRTSDLNIGDFKRQADAQPTRTLRDAHLTKFGTGSMETVGKQNLLKVQVADIRIEAMRNITPEMLPALASGNINDVRPDGRKTGLIGLLPPQIAMHIAGSSQPENFVPYRHTLEPFLGFALTRAIPNAVMRRIQDGLGDSIRHLSINGGRGLQFQDFSGV